MQAYAQAGPMLYLFPFLHQTTTWPLGGDEVVEVVSLSFSTSNHNMRRVPCRGTLLYLFPFLHQTTTSISSCDGERKLYLFPFLHQTTTRFFSASSNLCCISFLFYIKPQRWGGVSRRGGVVSLSFSTSNHNESVRFHSHHSVVSLSFSTSNHNKNIAN